MSFTLNRQHKNSYPFNIHYWKCLAYVLLKVYQIIFIVACGTQGAYLLAYTILLACFLLNYTHICTLKSAVGSAGALVNISSTASEYLKYAHHQKRLNAKQLWDTDTSLFIIQQNSAGTTPNLLPTTHISTATDYKQRIRDGIILKAYRQE